ncbi:MAG TPA: type I secretion system permease/ATPase [Alphaproteobacteria bacterium]|nr:type I secretion system permease/ATPase [Alphaproteobacteria bacterium]
MSNTKSYISGVIAQCRRELWVAFAFSFLISLLTLTGSFYMLQVYDRVLSSGSVDTLVYLTLIMVVAYVVYSVLSSLRQALLARVATKFDTMVAEDVFLAGIDRSRQPSLGPAGTQGLRDAGTLRNFITGNDLASLYDVPFAPIFLAFIYALHFWLGVTATIGAAISLLLAWLNQALTKKPVAEANNVAMASITTAEAAVRNAEAAEAMGMVPGLTARWRVQNQQGQILTQRATDIAAWIAGATKFVRFTLQSALLGVGAYLTLQAEVSGGAMIASSILMGRALAPVDQAIGTWKNVVTAVGARRRVDELLRLAPQRGQSMPLPAPEGHLSVERVALMLPGADKPILRGVSFALEAGESAGVIGPSAAGKSTLARVLVGVWRPNAGLVRLDGADVAQWDGDRLGPYVGYLPQDIELFPATVHENIARLQPGAPADAVVRAAQMAGVHDMILRLPQGYDTMIGPGGLVLSGGQRQRIALARALYGTPRFLVLDEPNSNLDQEGELALAKALAAAREAGITTVVISHRPSILTSVDKILVLRDGQVEAFGTRNDVLPRYLRGAGGEQRPRPAAVAGGAAAQVAGPGGPAPMIAGN